MISSRIKTLTYNAGLLRFFFRDLVPFVNVRSKILPKTLVNLVDDLNLDVLFLQEIWNERVARIIVSSLQERNFQVIRPRLSKLFGSGTIMAIRQSVRILSHKFLPFTAAASTDHLAAKGVIVLEALTPEKIPFLILGTHMQSIKTKNGIPLRKREVVAHQDQTRQLKEILLLATNRSQLSVLLLGDFNVGPGYAEDNYNYIAKQCEVNEAYLDFSPTCFEPTWDVGNPLVKAGWNSLEPSALIDHCFVRAGRRGIWKMISGKISMKERYDFSTKKISALTVPLSDHYALMSHLELAF